MIPRFDGRVAVITGAGKRLGRAYAHWLAARGARVVVNNRVHAGVPSTARRVVDEIVQAGGDAIADEHAVDDADGAHALISGAIAHFGKLDILICNAAISLVNTAFHETGLAQLRKLMEVNLWGTLYPLHAALGPMLRAGYGCIVLTTSQVALFGRAGSGPYAYSKSAMIGLTQAIACEGEAANVRINLIAPAAYTSISNAIGPEMAAVLAPAKVAPVVGWLCSEGCHVSGFIFNSGAGRIRRVQIVEGAPIEIANEDVAGCWPALDDMSGAVEARTAFESESGAILIPGRNVFKRQQDRSSNDG